MKLEIRLVNEKERALKNAGLTIKLVFKDGKERTLPTRTTNIRGEVTLDDINLETFKQVNFAKSQYQIRIGDTQTPWLKLGRPHKVSAEYFRYILTATGLTQTNDAAENRDSTLDNEPDQPTNPTIDPEQPQLPDVFDDGKWRIGGKLTTADGQPLKAKTIVAYFVNVNGLTEIAKARTLDNGRYQISYDWTANCTPDIQVQAKSQSKLIAESSIYFSVGRHVKIDLVANNETYIGPNQFDQIEEKILACNGDIQFQEVNEKTIEYLLGKTKVSAQQLKFYIASRRFGDGSEVPAMAYYGLFSAGISANLQGLATSSLQQLQTAMQTAVEKNVVAANCVDYVEPVYHEIRTKAIQGAINTTNQDSDASIGDLLTLAKVPKKNQTELLALYEKFAGDISGFWHALAADSAHRQYAASLKRVFQIGALTDYFYPATAAIHAALGNKASFASLAQWGKSDWNNIASQLKAVPDSIAGDTLKKRKENYIALMQTTVDHALVKERTASVLLSADVFKQTGVDQVIKAAPALDLQTANIGQQLDDLKITGKDRPALEQNLKGIQRIYRVAPVAHKPKVTEVLFGKNLDSAAKIVKYGKKPFITTFADSLGGSAIAKQVFHNAQQIAAINTNVATAMAEVKNASQFSMIGGGAQASSGLDIPSYAELFGSQSYCECEHCVSVYSPAAYLVDLLELLDKSLVEKTLGSGNYVKSFKPPAVAPLAGGIVAKEFKTGLDVLFNNRRRDIGHIELNCKNTNTVMPYIDLVNEQLEREVIKLNGDTVPSAKDLQTTWSTEELKANPEHINHDAYDILAASEKGFQLPFSLWNAEANAYLDQLAVNRHDLVSLIQGGTAPSLDQLDTILAAKLALTSLDIDILGAGTYHSDSRLRGLYGGQFSTPNLWKQELAEIPNFLQRTQLTFDELLSLLNTKFIKAFGQLGVDFSGSESVCDIDGAKLAYLENDKFTNKPLSNESLDMIQRFLRLRNKTNWSIHELACVLESIGDTHIKDSTLTKVGLVYDLANQHRLSPLEVASWLGVISTAKDQANDDERSFYESVFQNPAVSSPIETAFDIDPQNASQLLIKNVELSEYLSLIAGAIQLSQADTALIIDTMSGNTQLSLTNLSMLYKVASLCRAYEISVSEYLLMQRMLNIGPWHSVDNLQTFVRSLESVASSAFTIGELAYLLLHDATSVTEHGISDTELGVLLQSLSSSIAEIWAQYAVDNTPVKDQLLLLLEQVCITGGAELVIESIGSELSQTEIDTLLTQCYLDEAPSWFEGLFHYDQTIADTIQADTSLDSDQQITAIQQAHWQQALPTISDVLKQEHTIGTLTEQIATQFGLTLPMTNKLLLEMDQPFGATPLKVLSEPAFVNFNAEDANAFSVDVSLSKQQALLRYIAKVALLLVRVEADEQAIDLLTAYTLTPVLLNPYELTTVEQATSEDAFKAWWRTQELFALNAASKTTDVSLVKLLIAHLNDANEADRLNTAQDKPAVQALIDDASNDWDANNEQVLVFLDELAVLLNITLADIAAIADVGWLNLTHADLSNIYQLSALIHIAELTTKTGASPTLLKQCSTLDVSFEHAKQLTQVTRSHYSIEDWYKLAPEIRDPLRELQRDKLIAWLLHSENYNQPADIYNHLLIDPEMSACMMTSRIKLALSAVQLFLQRCMLSIEPELVEVHDPETWDWRKNYRVWEANRKVFLYPENWIEPELRLKKSEQFDAALGVLLQNEVTEEIAHKAMLTYLNGLDEVSNIDILSSYHDLNEEAGSERDNLHIIARTRGVPSTYYYRLRENGIWQPWEAIDLGIGVRQVIPVVKDNRLFVLWPSFVEKQAVGTDVLSKGKIESTVNDIVREDYYDYLMNFITVSSDGMGVWVIRLSDYFDSLEEAAIDANTSTDQLIDDLVDAGAQSIEEFGEEVRKKADNAFNYFEIRLNISEKTQQGWQKTITSESHIESDKTLVALELFADPLLPAKPEDFHFFSETSGDIIKIDCIQTIAFDAFDKFEVGNFSYDVLSKAIDVDDISPFGFTFKGGDKPTGTELIANAFTESSYSDYQITESDNDDELVTLLERTPNTFKTPIQSQLEDFTAHRPFFYGDKQAFYLVERVTGSLAKVAQTNEWLNATPLNTSIGNALAEIEKLPSGSFVKPTLNTQQKPIHNQISNLSPNGQLGQASHALAAELTDNSITKIFPTLANHYRFNQVYHPLVGELIRTVNGTSLEIALSRDTQSLREDYFESTYLPTEAVPSNRYPLKSFVFSDHNANGFYNWELFFHLPLLTATRLSKNQQFAEAQKWFHVIFNPTCRTGGEGPQRYWQFKPFYDLYDSNADHPSVSIYQQLLTMAQVENGNSQSASTSTDAEIASDTQAQIETWLANPFDPHAIAAIRPVAYMKATVTKYLENLIAWGDYLFRQFTIESINEATQYYILAYQILGDRPQALPKLQVKASSYFELGETDSFSNAIAELESTLSIPLLGNNVADMQPLYFCIPNNPNLTQYWDTVEDRLFKIRHCMDIDGVKRQLPLFQPPIDPAMLVKAVAAGVSIGAALAGMNTPAPKYRFSYLMQKAKEYCQEVKGLGNQLLTAIEKQDAEEIALLRADHQEALLNASNDMRNMQVEEARENLRAIEKTKATVEERIRYYEGLEKRSEKENSTIKLLDKSEKNRKMAGAFSVASSIAAAIPNGSFKFEKGNDGPYLSLTAANINHFGGSNIASILTAISSSYQNASARDSYQASKLSTEASHDRRWDDWKLQERLAKKELQQIETQIAAAEVRLALAEKERDNHALQLDQSREITEMMLNKFSNADLYTWQSSQVSSIYFQTYQLAYDLAKRAEKAWQREIGAFDQSFIAFGYWDSLKKGLMSGEKLQHDIQRMESDYINKNMREYELSKTISLLQLSPDALLTLRTTGECFIDIPEVLFELDYPAHYFRRIKNISLTIPLISGPYTTIASTLTLVSDTLRINPDKSDDLDEDTEQNLRVNYAASESIATSSAQADSGLFQLDFRDERYLPFEGAGVVSQWKLKIADPNLAQFDFDTISDVLIQINYTARNGGDVYGDAIETQLKTSLGWLSNSTHQVQQLISLRTQFSHEWAAFISQTTEDDSSISHELTIALDTEMMPYLLRKRLAGMSGMRLIIDTKDDQDVSWTYALTNTLLNPDTVTNETQGYTSDRDIDIPFNEDQPVTPHPLNTEYSLRLSFEQAKQLKTIRDIYLLCTLDTNAVDS